MEKMFLDDWPVLLRTGIVGVLAYAVLVVFLRVSGKRTLAKMNAFDFIVTVALGSTLASVLISKDVALAQGALALALLIGLQFLITWSSVRFHWVRRAVTGEPSLLFYRGEYLEAALRRVRVTRDEIGAAVRSAGLAAFEDVEAVILETDGSFSVVKGGGSGSSSLDGVRGPNRVEEHPKGGRGEKINGGFQRDGESNR